MTGTQPPWKVLLIGGSSGVGKTTVAPELAIHFGASCGQVDDFRLVLQRVTTPEQQAALHFFVKMEHVWRKPAEELLERLIEVARVVSWSLEIVVAHHVATSIPLVLEGDGIVPSMAAQCTFAGREAAGQVCSVFLFEPDEEVIYSSMRERGRGFEHQHPEEQQTQARLTWLYGQWLREQARQYGLPVLEARPRETLLERILLAVH